MTRSPSHAPARDPRAAIIAWSLAAVGLVAAGLVVAAWLGTMSDTETVGTIVGSLTLLGSLIAFLLSGALIASRQPGNIIGWLLLIPGVATPLSELGNAWLRNLDPVPTTTTPGMWIVLWFCSWSWLCLIFPIFHLLLTFPDGRLLSRRWRWIVALELAMIGFFVAGATVSAELAVLVNDRIVWSIPNPIGFLTQDIFESVIGPPWTIGLLTLTVGSVAAFILRYRRGSPEARHQLKWPMAAIVLFGLVYGAGAISSGFSDNAIWNVLFGVAIAAIPISVAVAVLKYRLYEIDRIISRTVSWAVITGLLLALFVGLVIGLQAALTMLTNGQTVAVAASTLVVAALFEPIRSRVQRRIDRRFNRARHDAEMTVSSFAGRLRGDVDLASVSAELRSTAMTAFEPHATGIWLRGSHR